MTVLRDVLARFGIDVEAGPLEDLDEGIGAVVGNLQKMATTLASGVAINALRDFVVEMAQAAGQISDTSKRLGISTDGLQEWRYAAQRNGVAAEDFDSSLGRLQTGLAGAVSGNKAAAGAFRQLGVDVRGADGEIRTMDDVLLDMADGFARIENPTERAALATRLFGQAGARLVPLLASGAAGVQELRAEFHALGGGASREMIENSTRLNDALDRTNLVIFGLKARVANLLLPTFTRWAETTTDLLAGFTQMADKSHVLEAALVVLGATAIAVGWGIMSAWAGPILVTAAVAAGIAFLILLVDDLITLFSGGTSVIGGFMDELFGAGTAAELVAELTEAWEGLKLAITDAYHAVREFMGEDVETTASGDQRQQTRGFDPNMAITAAEDQARVAEREVARIRALGMGSGAVAQAQERATTLRTRADEQARSAQVRGVDIPTGAQGGGGSVSVSSPVTINLPPGTDRAQVEALRRAVDERLDERNRQAAAALGSEAVEE